MTRIPTCWEDCRLCEEKLYSERNRNPKKRIFALCGHPDRAGAKCFEFDAICNKADLHRLPPTAKSTSPGWSDY